MHTTCATTDSEDAQVSVSARADARRNALVLWAVGRLQALHMVKGMPIVSLQYVSSLCYKLREKAEVTVTAFCMHGTTVNPVCILHSASSAVRKAAKQKKMQELYLPARRQRDTIPVQRNMFMQLPYFKPATQCLLNLAFRCVGQAAYKVPRSNCAWSSNQ